MRVRPIADRVLIRPTPNPTETASGLVLAEPWTPEQSGEIVAIGPAVKELCTVHVAIFSWQIGQELCLDDHRYLMMRESDVLAVLEG